MWKYQTTHIVTTDNGEVETQYASGFYYTEEEWITGLPRIGVSTDGGLLYDRKPVEWKVQRVAPPIYPEIPRVGIFGINEALIRAEDLEE